MSEEFNHVRISKELKVIGSPSSWESSASWTWAITICLFTEIIHCFQYTDVFDDYKKYLSVFLESLYIKQVTTICPLGKNIYSLNRTEWMQHFTTLGIRNNCSSFKLSSSNNWASLLGNCDIDFLTFAIKKCETLKFQICSKETKILQSSFESTKSKIESLQSTLKFHESLELYHWNFVNSH